MNPEEKLRYKTRIWIFYLILVAMLGTLVIGLAKNQLFDSSQYADHEKRQNHRRILTPGPRGQIFDREGRVLVANSSKFSAVVYLSDRQIRSSFRREYVGLVKGYREQGEDFNSGETEILARANVIQSYLDDVNRMLGRNDQVAPITLTRHFNAKPFLPFPLINELSREEFAILIESLPVESPVQIYASNVRHYPFESAASHTLGYVVSNLIAPDKNSLGDEFRTFSSKGSFGKNGIEKRYDDLLQGKIGTEIWVIDNQGFQIERVDNQYPEKGQNLTSSLDIDLQLVAEAAFDAYDDKGALVALDIETTEVLAMVSKPDYNLNDTTPYISNATAKQIEADGAWQNKALSGVYPPGSPFKLVTAVAGLKSGIITSDTIIDCEGYVKVGNRRFPCHNRSGHGETDLRKAISVSCNSYFYTVAIEMGHQALSREAIYLGLNGRTNIDLPHETRSMLVPTEQWKRRRYDQPWVGGDTPNMAIGQGFLLSTPLQMALTVASNSKNEVYTKPTILKQSETQLARRPKPKPLGLPNDTHQAIIDGMSKAVVEGTAKFAKVLGINVGGKTGTAQVRVKGGTLELAWFVGIAPIENPKIAIAVVVESDEIGKSHGGGQYAAPMAQLVLQAYFEKQPAVEQSSEDATTAVSHL